MTNKKDYTQYFRRLRERFGDHSKAARHLGIDPSHYRHIRRTGRMSAGLARLIEVEATRETTQAQQ